LTEKAKRRHVSYQRISEQERIVLRTSDWFLYEEQLGRLGKELKDIRKE
jgi:hypothetical protein